MFQRWLLPGFLFQSVLIGGGYATGRELVEFFLSHGPLGGLLGMLLATALFSMVSIVFFEFARISRSLTYKDFFRHLLGRFGFLYEVGYVLLGVLVISVVGAAAGEIAQSSFGLDQKLGTLVLCLCVVYLVFRGTGTIERVLASWSILLYVVFALFLGLFLSQKGGQLSANLSVPIEDAGWLLGSLEYVGYSMVVLPVIVFVSQHFQSRRDTLIAGVLCGPIVMAPALLFYLAMAADYEAMLAEPVPSEYMIRTLNLGWLSAVFYITLFGTFVETASAFIHAFNERMAETLRAQGRVLSPTYRALIAIGSLVISVLLAGTFGLVDLIAQGYGTLTWYFILIFLLPLMTFGVYKVIFSDAANVTVAPSISAEDTST